ncbi:RNA polymerase sigma factor [Dictyobacter alpinus]|uniref:RNA polymerase sigma factor n=1 Tax=Dictyobacter alpinus TaxID=2014873 RepID=A0A402BCP3_9CHLR|nr:RNA polymerase sigma factor [Dictyobacter alpinus]GCE29104.1 RNA polymerase sigma factor [Dictyobacter alpinus]
MIHATAGNDADFESVAESEQLSALIVRVKEGDGTAFEQLVQMRYTQIRLFLTYMVTNKEVGYDLTQETFLRVWQEFPTLRDPAKFDSWLYSIARRLALNYLRREKILHWLPWHEWLDHAPKEENTKGFEKSVEERILLSQALATVPPRYRASVILQVIHGMPQKQIADLLSIKEKSTSTFVHRGLKILQEAYLNLEQK